MDRRTLRHSPKLPKNIAGVIREYEAGLLHSGSSTGRVVTNPRQAVAIALSEQRSAKAPVVHRVNSPAQQHPNRNLGQYLHARKGR